MSYRKNIEKLIMDAVKMDLNIKVGVKEHYRNTPFVQGFRVTDWMGKNKYFAWDTSRFVGQNLNRLYKKLGVKFVG